LATGAEGIFRHVYAPLLAESRSYGRQVDSAKIEEGHVTRLVSIAITPDKADSK
jgi:hypothetical protein